MAARRITRRPVRSSGRPISAARIYIGELSAAQKKQIAWLGLGIALLVPAAFLVSISKLFFGLIPVTVSTTMLLEMIAVVCVAGIIQWFIARRCIE